MVLLLTGIRRRWPVSPVPRTEPTERHDDDPRRPYPASSAPGGGRWSDAEERRDAIVIEPGHSGRAGRPRSRRRDPATSSGPSSWHTRPSNGIAGGHPSSARPSSSAMPTSFSSAAVTSRPTTSSSNTASRGPRPTGRLRFGGQAASGLAAAEARRLTGETIPVEDPRKRATTFRSAARRRRGDHAMELPDGIPVEYVGPALASGKSRLILKPAPTTAGIAALLAERHRRSRRPRRSVQPPDRSVRRDGVGPRPACSVSSLSGSSGRAPSGAADRSAGVGQGARDGARWQRLSIRRPRRRRPGRSIAVIGAAAFSNAGQSCAAAERVIAAWSGRTTGSSTASSTMPAASSSVTRATPRRRWVRSTTREWPRRWTTTWPTRVRWVPPSPSAGAAAMTSRRACTTSPPSWPTCPTVPR